MRKTLIGTLCLLFCSVSMLSQDIGTIRKVDTERKKKGKGSPLRVAFDVNWTFGINAIDFFRDYGVLLGGTARSFETPTGFSLGIESFQFDNVGLGIMSGYYKAVMRETYFYDPDASNRPAGPAQTISQNIEMQVIPTYAFVDLFNVYRQFTGYIGAGIGLASVGFTWDETLSPSTEPGNRRSGIRYDESTMAFAAMFRTGVSLGFDDPFSKTTSAAIYFEAGYSYIPFSAPVFAQAGRTLPFEEERTQQDYSFQAGGIVLKLGFSVLLTPTDQGS